MNKLSKGNAKKFLFDLDNANFLAVFDEYSDGVMITNTDGVIVYYNQAMSRIDELDPENVILTRVTDVYDLDDETSIIMQCLAKGSPIVDQPIYYRTRMGKFANTIHSVFPVFNRNRMVGAVCFIRDYNVLTETLATMHLPESQKRIPGHEISFESIIGQDPSFRDALNAARMAASTPSPVMLYGETGTGKELFARAIHNHSPRYEKKYTPVNCAAIPENLLEGILFGTSKGAFTGSINKAGLFERTSQGTIFLDEINSMPVGLQSKILRIVQEGKVRRVGALKEIKFDVKIISSVNQDPHTSITDGSLRSDLFYRLGVVFIHIVPLRKRLGDLELLVRHFITKHNKLLYKQVAGVEKEVMEMFRQYHWPGNVRELEHVIEGAMNIIGNKDRIGTANLQPHFSNWFSSRRSPGPRPSPGIAINPATPEDAGDGGLILNKQEHEKKMIAQALGQHRGNITRAADKLGISRQLLYYKMKKFQFTRENFQ
ncbi:sigma-54 interaction domain-containing protein [Desulfospira joergensenii]|uniref:sigma-54 interaction domain-containing protein n=1 Tax=Desulfospira joergensenii TaxID=53329 RepID=UPI0003B450E3|nr:sigma-54-dependent Fis family transcriptional regulator [Desulfospira joergensenii]